MIPPSTEITAIEKNQIATDSIASLLAGVLYSYDSPTIENWHMAAHIDTGPAIAAQPNVTIIRLNTDDLLILPNNGPIHATNRILVAESDDANNADARINAVDDTGNNVSNPMDTQPMICVPIVIRHQFNIEILVSIVNPTTNRNDA